MSGPVPKLLPDQHIKRHKDPFPATDPWTQPPMFIRGGSILLSGKALPARRIQGPQDLETQLDSPPLQHLPGHSEVPGWTTLHPRRTALPRWPQLPRICPSLLHPHHSGGGPFPPAGVSEGSTDQHCSHSHFPVKRSPASAGGVWGPDENQTELVSALDTSPCEASEAAGSRVQDEQCRGTGVPTAASGDGSNSHPNLHAHRHTPTHSPPLPELPFRPRPHSAGSSAV